MQGCVWYKTDFVEAFYPLKGADEPDFNSSFGTLDRGYLFDVVGRWTDPGDNEWVKIVRRNDEGLPAVLWVPMLDLVSARKQGVWFEHAIPIPNPGEPEVSPFSGKPANGKVMVVIQSGLFKDSALTKKLRDALPGEMFWFDSETDGVLRTWYEVGGTSSKLYFKRDGLLAHGFGAPFPNIMLADGGAQDWSAVPEVKPDPEPEPVETLWQKIVKFFKAIIEWLKKLFGQ